MPNSCHSQRSLLLFQRAGAYKEWTKKRDTVSQVLYETTVGYKDQLKQKFFILLGSGLTYYQY